MSGVTASKPVLAIAGVGLLGGSVALAAKAAGLVSQVIGIGRSAERLQAAVQQGVIDSYRLSGSVATAVEDWDLVVVATPVDRIPDDVRQLAAASKPGVILTDVGSVKGSVVDTLRGRLPKHVRFVGSHPVAGSDKGGFENAQADLFRGKKTIITPDPQADPETARAEQDAVRILEEFWTGLGSRVVRMSPAEHDRILASTSHTPHVVAAALASILTDELTPFAGSGFCDTTRIAGGGAELWVSILTANRDEVLASLAEFDAGLQSFREALQTQDCERLQALLQAAKTRRDSLDR